MPKEEYRGPLFYKFLKEGGVPPIHKTRMRWDLPTFEDGVWIPGKWKVLRPPIEVCGHGLHAAPADQVWRFTSEFLYEVEYDDRPYSGPSFDTPLGKNRNVWLPNEVFQRHTDDTKVAGRKARLTRQITGWNETAQTEIARTALRAATEIARSAELPAHYIEAAERRIADPALFCSFNESMAMADALNRPHPDMIAQGRKSETIRRYRQIIEECRQGGWYLWILLGYLRMHGWHYVSPMLAPPIDQAVRDFFPNLIAAETPT